MEERVGRRRKCGSSGQTVASDLASWSEDVVGDLEKRIKKARSELETCMLATISREKIEEETRLRFHLEHLEEPKNIKWRQCAHAWQLRLVIVESII
jgi:hypothetical protein